MGSVAVIVNGTALPLTPEEENVATALYRHDCANKGNYGEECPDRWSKFASHEDEQAHLKLAIQNDPIIHRQYFNKEDKKCLWPFQPLLHYVFFLLPPSHTLVPHN